MVGDDNDVDFQKLYLDRGNYDNFYQEKPMIKVLSLKYLPIQSSLSHP